MEPLLRREQHPIQRASATKIIFALSATYAAEAVLISSRFDHPSPTPRRRQTRNMRARRIFRGCRSKNSKQIPFRGRQKRKLRLRRRFRLVESRQRTGIPRYRQTSRDPIRSDPRDPRGGQINKERAAKGRKNLTYAEGGGFVAAVDRATLNLRPRDPRSPPPPPPSRRESSSSSMRHPGR